jgi:hypothetical protein
MLLKFATYIQYKDQTMHSSVCNQLLYQ